jgi:hypothetical protein
VPPLPAPAKSKTTNNSFIMRESNAFCISTKISDTFEIGSLVTNFESKFKLAPEAWFLGKNTDGINLYTDRKGAYQGFSLDYMSREEASAILEQ